MNEDIRMPPHIKASLIADACDWSYDKALRFMNSSGIAKKTNTGRVYVSERRLREYDQDVYARVYEYISLHGVK